HYGYAWERHRGRWMAPRELNSGFFSGTIGQRFQPARGRDLAERDDGFGRGIGAKIRTQTLHYPLRASACD
ncbi:MAG: hypothetical protein WAV72_29705, partial [Bradyrhizobium sp.]